MSRSQVNVKPSDPPYRESYDITKYNQQFNAPRTPIPGQQKYELPAVRESPNREAMGWGHLLAGDQVLGGTKTPSILPNNKNKGYNQQPYADQ